MTGRPGHRNTSCRTSCAHLAYPGYVYFNRFGSKGACSFPGATWDRFRCTVEPSPGHIRCRFLNVLRASGLLGWFLFLVT